MDKVKVYERFKDDKGNVVEAVHEMWAVDAREAVQNGGGRFSTSPFSDEKATADNSLSDELKVVHRGRGSYSVMRGETELHEGLTKEEAEKKLEELKAA
ncbi:hypothetical protein DC522_05920 [Microvirga sp. KLBC 81]|uniref:hypothetical protein n=1 Tax=Microvirga sp. KLBC 81 TaxID=1862707 RepID=UPI000D505FDA|nr:hypothetical protein [Microvirga sp. KLBC 81]PVE25430.1 hypothetical protein DC522_05920 [Microvirga sp. KLBC 81]